MCYKSVNSHNSSQFSYICTVILIHFDYITVTDTIIMKNKPTDFSTTFLLPKNDFFIGMGSVLNIRGSYFKYKTSKSENQADTKAIDSDWRMTGRDICLASEEFFGKK